MTYYFADTSALAKRYLQEPGSEWILQEIDQTSQKVVVIAELTTIEMQSLLSRRVREGTLSFENKELLRGDFLLHVRSQYLVIALDSAVLDIASRLINTHPLRTLDAIQLASALHAKMILGEPMVFLCADHHLLSAATAEGMHTENPVIRRL